MWKHKDNFESKILTCIRLFYLYYFFHYYIYYSHKSDKKDIIQSLERNKESKSNYYFTNINKTLQIVNGVYPWNK